MRKQRRTGGWLHGAGEPIAVDWSDPDGNTWRVRAWWAEVDGRGVLIGMDVHGFSSRGNSGWSALGEHNPPELRSKVLRSLPVARLADECRIVEGAFARATGLPAPKSVQRRPKRRRKREAVLADDQLKRVAEVYQRAMALGGEPRRKPARYVETTLAAEGFDGLEASPRYPVAQSARVRKWIARARRHEYLAAPQAPLNPTEED